MMPVPNGLPSEVAALTEPMAVGWHAVRRGEVGKRTVAIVIGCGPIGLAVILLLKARGVRTVVASDYSPAGARWHRRAGRTWCSTPPWTRRSTPRERRGHLADIPSVLELAVGTREKLERLPFGWWHAWRLGESARRRAQAPGHLRVRRRAGRDRQHHRGCADVLARGRRRGVRGRRPITPAMAINKEIDLRFVVGYTPLEFRDTLHMLAEGEVDPRPLITGTVGLDGVGAAFAALGDPECPREDPDRPGSSAVEPLAFGA